MTNWKYSVYLTDLFHDFYDKDEEGLATTDDIANVVTEIYNRLMLLKNQINKRGRDPDEMLGGCSGLDFIIDDFNYFDKTGEYEEQIEEFDRIMTDLYDFADGNFVWINTMDRNSGGIGKP